MDNLSIGKLGEDIAVKYLADHRYKIVERNYRQKFGEIDIVAKAPDKTIVFVEVKTLVPGRNGIRPEDNMTAAKIQKSKKIAEFYAIKNSEKIGDRGWRIDMIAIELPARDSLTESEKDCVIRYYENI